MNAFFLYLPYLISFLLGYSILNILFYKKKPIDTSTHLFLSLGLGLGVSSQIGFSSLLLFDQINKNFIVIANWGILFLLLLIQFLLFKKDKTPLLPLNTNHFKSALPCLFIFSLALPLWMIANFYPFGGWDAWSVWNFKAKFLFLGGSSWTNMFNPLLWRSSPHYPLLLPLINVWGWIYFGSPTCITPLLTSLIFTLMTAGLLFSGLRLLTKHSFCLLPALLMLSLPFFTKLATSQYCDIVLSYFLLATLFCLVIAKIDGVKSLALLAGIFLGFLSFTKTEGTIASLIIIPLAIFYFRLKKEKYDTPPTGLINYFLIGIFISSIPTILFQLKYAPTNQTFINGLFSSSHPVSTYRLKIIGVFLAVELVSRKWNGLWVLLGLGTILSRKKCLNKIIIIVPIFLFFYMSIILSYYFINTYFEIKWWLKDSLNRILLAIIPTFLFWIFFSLWHKKESSPKDTHLLD